jgi:uncharacterized protein GlcG (DUF336 family)
MTLTLAEAQGITVAALAEARARNCKPLSVIVLDAGGHPVVYQREDRSSLFRFDIARAKAMGALGMGADTRELVARAANNPQFFASLSAVVNGQLALAAGGVLIRDPQGTVRGAVGVSGDTGEVDEACAHAGIKSAGLSYGEQK